MKIGAYPIDEEWLGEFARNHEKILIIEELAPVVEEAVRQVAGCVPVFGKSTGMHRTKANFRRPLSLLSW